jgi:hypothetical protein
MGKIKDSRGPTTVETFQIRTNGILKYEMFLNSSRSEKRIENEKNLTRGEFKGYLSQKTKSTQKKYLTNWIEAIELHQLHYNKKSLSEQITFVTLTLPATQVHSDNYLKRECLDRFIVKVKRDYGVLNYFWRAEAQKNGNIHFHLLLDAYIHHSKLRATWNRVLEPHGYINAYASNQKEFHKNGFTLRAGDSRDKETQYLAYCKGKSEDWRNPNSTDIIKPKQIRNVAAYICKYITKDSIALACDIDTMQEVEIRLDRPIEGRLWGCSDAIRELHYLDEGDLPLTDKCEPDKQAPVDYNCCKQDFDRGFQIIEGRTELQKFMDAVNNAGTTLKIRMK